jgi:hypothetical protein
MAKVQKLLKKCLPNLGRKGISLPNTETVTHTPPGETPITGPPRLPTELLIAIIDLVYGRIELSRLCRTCRLFQTIVEPRLYQVYLPHSEWFKRVDIRQIIRHTRLEFILNTVILELYGWKYCKGRPKLSFIKNSNRRRIACRCDKLDECVGKSLVHLINLKVLRLDCDLCGVQSCQRHGWISALETRSLQEINVTCHCSRIDEEMTIKIFSSPCMNSVTMLGWHVYRSVSHQAQLLDFHLMREPILPNLRYLDHRGSSVDNLLLYHQPITRLSCTLDLGRGLNSEDLREKRGITHLNIHCINWGIFGSWYLDCVAENPSPFQNLQHFGSFPLTSSSSIVSQDNIYIENPLN